jgi:adenylate cyclase
MGRDWGGWKFLAPLAVLGLGVALFLIEPLPLSALRLAGFDLYQRVLPRDYEPAPVRVVDIDEASLARLGQWPWPRTRIAELVEQLDEKGAAAVVFDVMFAEADRTSPRALLEVWDVAGDMRDALAALPDHDQLLAERMRDRPVVLGFALERFSEGGALEGPWRYVVRGQPVAPYLHAFSGAVESLPVLREAAAGQGALSFVPDHDGVVRRVPLVLGLNGQPVPTLVSEALRVALGERVYLLRTGEEPGAGLQEFRVGPVAAATTRHGEIWVHYTRPHPERTIPAWRVFPDLAGSDAATVDDIAGNVVLIGSSAQGLMDLRFSPLGGVMPGVEAHAQALEQILLERTLDRPHWTAVVELAALVAGGFLVGAAALLTGALGSALLTLVVVVGLIGAGWWAFASASVLLDPTLPALVILLVFIVASLMRHLASEHQQRYLKGAFARYVSPNLVEHLVEHPGALALGGERRVCSFIFTDLAGFTSLMEKMDPAEAVALLNGYLDRMIGIAFEHQGTLDRIVGDAVAILFSAPLAQPDHAQRALTCALAMKRFADAYTADLQARGVAFGKTRIGVHSGEVIIGNFGGSTIFDYRALGDAVNTAARLESVNKHLGTWICVSDLTLASCSGIATRPVGRLVLKGKTEPLLVHEPIDEQAGSRPDPDFPERYRRAFALLAAGDPEAVAAFVSLERDHPDDPLVALHLRRLRAGERTDLIVMAEK